MPEASVFRGVCVFFIVPFGEFRLIRILPLRFIATQPAAGQNVGQSASLDTSAPRWKLDATVQEGDDAAAALEAMIPMSSLDVEAAEPYRSLQAMYPFGGLQSGGG
ncbi:hypothetical protein [Paraburkholderia domus]|uniref:hypothetical protein n=1 Tax=Paraburkholderia domus TaxID=2793075 RepID=UPI001B8AC19B|nr:hypothetical protein [Paraburkholderia domus]